MQKSCKFQQKIDKVTIISPQNTFIEVGAEIGAGTIIYPHNYIKSGVKIGKNCTLYPNNYIEKSLIGNSCNIGPFAHIREGSELKNKIRLGNFCEVKASIIKDNTKIAHLTYLGDAVIGKNCNIGCGVVFANFDGKIKQKITVKDDCFIGCNTNLIAPLTIGKNCYIGAGTTITKSLKNNSFVVGNRDLKIKENLFKIIKKH